MHDTKNMTFFATIATTFVTVFLAELGDKTQLATLSFATGSTSRLAVFLGASLALVATSAVAVLAADVLGRMLNPTYLKIGSALLFIVIGVAILVSLKK